MRKGWLALALCFALLCGTAAGEETVRKNVFYTTEREMFGADTETLDLYVAPLLGADCMCLICGGETMLVDTGKISNYPDVKAMLDELGIKRLDHIYNSHPHDDHLEAFGLLVKDYEVGEFVTPFPKDYWEPFTFQREAVKAAEEAGVPVREVHHGDVLTLGGCTMTVFQDERTTNVNQRSGLLLVTFGDRKLLLTGDCNEVVGRRLAEKYDLHADILKYPHHGVGYVFSEQVEHIAPEFVIFPHGYFNTKNNRRLLNRLHIPFCFASWGVVHAATDGKIWVVGQTLTEDGKAMMEKYGEVKGVWD